MVRNFDKAAEEGSKLLHNKPRYGITTTDMQGMYEMYINDPKGRTNALYYIMIKAYEAGTAAGYRMRKAEERRKVS